MFISNDWEPILNHEFNQEYMKELFKRDGGGTLRHL